MCIRGSGQKFGTLLTASLSFLLVLGIIVGGGLLRGMKKPLSPGGIDSVSDSVSRHHRNSGSNA